MILNIKLASTGPSPWPAPSAALQNKQRSLAPLPRAPSLPRPAIARRSRPSAPLVGAPVCEVVVIEVFDAHVEQAHAKNMPKVLR